MVKLVVTLVFWLMLFSAALPSRVVAQTGDMMNDVDPDNEAIEGGSHNSSIEEILGELLNQQNVSTIQNLDFSKVSDTDWERLGDAVMELYHPGQAHETMDQMMGGEGSESLRQMHINMGKAYLGYGGNFSPGMIGGGMMGNWNNNFQRGGGVPMMGFGSMMGYGSNSGVYGVLGGLTWIALIAFLVAGAYFFIKQAGKK